MASQPSGCLFQRLWPTSGPGRRLRRGDPEMDRGDDQGASDVFINGDGETSRDFCFIDNAVQANLLAATTTDDQALNQVYNVAVAGVPRSTSFSDSSATIHCPRRCSRHSRRTATAALVMCASKADITKASGLLGYKPTHRLAEGVVEAMPWYVAMS